MSEIHTQESPDLKPCAGEGCSPSLHEEFVGQLLHAWLNSFMETDRNCERIQGYYLGKNSWRKCSHSQKSYSTVVAQLLMVFVCICFHAYAMIFLTLSSFCFVGVRIRPKGEMECDHSKTNKVFLSQILEPIKDSICFFLFFFCSHACAH